MGKLKHKVKGATILESLIATLLLLLCFTAATTIYVNVLHSGDKARKLQTSLLLKEIAEKTITEKIFVDQQFTEGSYHIQKQISKYNSNSEINLWHLKLIVTDVNNLTIAEHNQIICE